MDEDQVTEREDIDPATEEVSNLPLAEARAEVVRLRQRVLELEILNKRDNIVSPVEYEDKKRIAELEEGFNRLDVMTRADGSPPPLELVAAVITQTSIVVRRALKAEAKVKELEEVVKDYKDNDGNERA